MSGMIFGWLRPNASKMLATYLEKWVKVILKGIVYIIPIFMAGFIIKIKHDQLMSSILKQYLIIFIIVSAAVFAYIFVWYWVVNRFKISGAFQCLKNMLPAALAGFGSMSSAAAMPLTLLGTEKNSNNPLLVQSVIPMTVNIHLVGDCFAIPIFAYAILHSFGIPEPSFGTYLTFACYFVLAKFSVAAVPGGGILVMLPIIETYLGFNTEMLTWITALYLLFDPVITSANVLGNGGFALVVNKIMEKEEATQEESTG